MMKTSRLCIHWRGFPHMNQIQYRYSTLCYDQQYENKTAPYNTIPLTGTVVTLAITTTATTKTKTKTKTASIATTQQHLCIAKAQHQQQWH